MHHCDISIIGGGLVGLSTALRLMEKRPDLHVAVVEKENRVAAHQSGHNSGVIHSGIYYIPGSQKAVNCMKGYRMLLDFCDQYNVGYDLCGKLIVAKHPGEEPVLKTILERGKANGLAGLKWIDGKDALDYEPHVSCQAAIVVPQAGIIDFAALAKQIAAVLVQRGGSIHLGTRIREIRESGNEVRIETGNGSYSSKYLVTCAGLYADKLARKSGIDPGFEILPFRGEFYRVGGESEKLVRGLIYPVPDMRYPFLGIHLTKVFGGGLEAGPNAVLAWQREGYRFAQVHAGEFADMLRYRGFWRLAARHWQKGISEIGRSLSRATFYSEVRKLVPEVRKSDLVHARSGVRAQAVDKRGNLIYDYVIRQTARSFHVCNAPSPAATSCLSIGDYVASRVLEADVLT